MPLQGESGTDDPIDLRSIRFSNAVEFATLVASLDCPSEAEKIIDALVTHDELMMRMIGWSVRCRKSPSRCTIEDEELRSFEDFRAGMLFSVQKLLDEILEPVVEHSTRDR